MSTMVAPASPMSKLPCNPSEAREEGELPYYDGDDPPNCHEEPVVNVTVPPAPVDPQLVASVSKDSRGLNTGKSISGIHHASSFEYHSKNFAEGSHRNIISRNVAPFNPDAHGWSQASGANNNLVIRFSDNDSSSDSEESRQEKAPETEIMAPGVTGNKKLFTPAWKRMDTHQSTTSRAKPVPKKISLNHKFVSSTSKANGTNTRSSVWQGPRVRNFRTLNKNKDAPQEQASNRGMDLNSSKLRDLRQQIAMREKELKLKSALQSKEKISGLYKDGGIRNLKNDSMEKSQATSTDVEQSDMDESDRKRRKVNEACSDQLNWKQLPSSKSAVASKGLDIGHKTMKEDDLSSRQLNPDVRQDFPTLQSMDTVHVSVPEGNVLLQEKSMDCHGSYGVPIGRAMPSCVVLQKQKDRLASGLKGSLPSGSKGGHMVASCSPPKRSSRLLDPLMQSRTASFGNVPCKRSGAMELRRPNKVTGNPPSNFSPNKDAYEQTYIRSCENHGRVPQDKTPLLVSDDLFQGSLNIATVQTHSDEVNISPQGNLNVRSLEELEEMHDRELEEAQEHRRRCEIEEREALKAYRKAQRALAEANHRCSHAYRQRELYSAWFQSFITGDSRADAVIVPMLKHPLGNEFNSDSQLAGNSAAQFAEGVLVNASDRNVDEWNLSSKACSDPDANTSELLHKKLHIVANGIRSPSIGHSIEDEDEETHSPGHGYVQPCSYHPVIDESDKEKEEPINNGPKTGLPFDSPNDYLLLEESLRSKLVARFGKRSSSSTGLPQIVGPAANKWALNDDECEKHQITMDGEAFSETESSQHSDEEGSARHSHHEVADENQSCMSDALGSLNAIPGSPILLSTFSHLKVASTRSCTGMPDRDKHEGTFGICNGDMIHVSYEKVQQVASDGSVGENGSCVIDPFWPLCIYALRGKCNNEECPWQHVKENSGSNGSDSHAGSLTQEGELDGATQLPKCLNNHFGLSPPVYFSLDSLKAELHAYESVLAQSIGRCALLAVPCLLGREIASNPPYFIAADSSLEAHGTWDRLSFYFQNRNDKLDLLKKGFVDSEQTLETVFLALRHGIDKSEGITKALGTLSRALENDPTLAILWIVYLHIFYSDKKSIGKDDMFFYAVKHNDGCYELWLMYINSRMRLDDRFVAYDTALSALCHHASADAIDSTHASACILDLFLQMSDCFCMCGDVEKLIQRIREQFLHATAKPNRTHLSYVFNCLTVSDKCILWVCCVYLVIYKKLPDKITPQFEIGKELSVIEWPSVDLTTDDKEKAIKLMEFAIDSVGFSNHAAVHMLAINHVRCTAALDGLECSLNLLMKYTQMYPSCLELVLMLARAQKHGFKEAVGNWFKEVPGAQCLWNQYAEHLLRNGRSDFAKVLMDRWFRSVGKAGYTFRDGDNVDMSDLNHMDAMFGFLNLCLYYRLLQNDHHMAQSAMDWALKVAAPKEFVQCVREHAVLFFLDEPLLEGGRVLLNLLKGYLFDARAERELVLLSRKSILGVKKLRVRQLLDGILGSVSHDFSLINSVLESCYGPSLLPWGWKLESLVDFVEAVMEICPSNYEFVFCVCNKCLLSGGPRPDGGGAVSANALFWAASLLVNSIIQVVPVAPENVWVAAVNVMNNVMGMESLSEMFNWRGLSVYPFSVRLWRSYIGLRKMVGNGAVGDVVGTARERGVVLDDGG